MRLFAAALLVLAAFAVGVPMIDRAGLALLGLACYALARSPGGSLRPRPAVLPFPWPTEAPMPEPEPVTRDLRERVSAYSEDGR